MQNNLNIDPNSSLKDLFWAVFKTSTALMSIRNLDDKKILVVNDAWLAAFKFDSDDIFGEGSLQPNIWSHEELKFKTLKKISENERIEDAEVIFKAKDGSFLYCRRTVSHIKLGDKTLLLSSSKDITNEHLTGKALSASQEILIDALETINEGFVLYGADGGLVVCNSKFRELLD